MRLLGKQFAVALVALASTITFGQPNVESSLKSVYLSGRLTDASGHPISNATVELSRRGVEGDLATQRTSSNGRFVFRANPMRAYMLRFVAPGFNTVILPIDAKTPGLELDDVVAIVAASPANDTKQPDVLPPDLLDQVKEDLGLSSVQDCIIGSGEVFEQMIRTERLNLATRRQSILVEGLGPCFAGANNGQMLIYALVGSKWRNVFDESGNHVETLSSRTLGFLDIARWQHDSAFASIRYVYHFDGNSYRVAACNVVQFSDQETGEEYRRPRYAQCSWDWKRHR